MVLWDLTDGTDFGHDQEIKLDKQVNFRKQLNLVVEKMFFLVWAAFTAFVFEKGDISVRCSWTRLVSRREFSYEIQRWPAFLVHKMQSYKK